VQSKETNIFDWTCVTRWWAVTWLGRKVGIKEKGKSRIEKSLTCGRGKGIHMMGREQK
jgi:hypothetical protein